MATENGTISEVVIPNFSLSREFLTCYVQASSIQVVGGVEIRAGCEEEYVVLHVSHICELTIRLTLSPVHK